MVEGKGINDMPYGWTVENDWNKRVYSKWRNMLYRCYNKEFHKTEKGKHYIGCTICDRWLTLSNFVEDFPKLDGYDEEMFLNGELELDKDIKSNGTNKQYIMVECMLVTHDENMKQATKTRGFTEEHKRKISEAMQGKFGLNNCSKKVAQYDRQTLKLIKIWDSMHDVERELGIAYQNICACCKGKQKSAGGYIWKYVEEEF